MKLGPVQVSDIEHVLVTLPSLSRRQKGLSSGSQSESAMFLIYFFLLSILAFLVSNSSADDNELETLEHVLVTVSLTHLKRGMLQIQLVCPSGTTSVIGARRKKDE